MENDQLLDIELALRLRLNGDFGRKIITSDSIPIQIERLESELGLLVQDRDAIYENLKSIISKLRQGFNTLTVYPKMLVERHCLVFQKLLDDLVAEYPLIEKTNI